MPIERVMSKPHFCHISQEMCSLLRCTMRLSDFQRSSLLIIHSFFQVVSTLAQFRAFPSMSFLSTLTMLSSSMPSNLNTPTLLHGSLTGR